MNSVNTREHTHTHTYARVFDNLVYDRCQKNEIDNQENAGEQTRAQRHTVMTFVRLIKAGHHVGMCKK